MTWLGLRQLGRQHPNTWRHFLGWWRPDIENMPWLRWEVGSAGGRRVKCRFHPRRLPITVGFIRKYPSKRGVYI